MRLLLAQFQSLIIWVLIGAAIVSGLLGEWVDAAAIIAIVVLNGVMGFIQEFRAEPMGCSGTGSSRMTTEGSVEPLDDAARQVILDANASFAQNALRVLGIARRSLEHEPSEFYEKELNET